MNQDQNPQDDELYNRLRWLMASRLLFAIFLIGSTIILHLRDSLSPLSPPLLVLYGLIFAILALSVCYALILKHVRRRVLFAYIQIGIDTVFVSLIIFVTGSFASIFSFLYLLVIIYASMLLYKSGSMITAALCSIQYGIMIDLEYYGVIVPFGMEVGLIASGYDVSYVFYKIIFTMVACFAVAFLSSFLSVQARETKKELRAMEDHIKRVEKMAAIGEMAAGLAHEIKNPLAALSGSIQLLRDGGRTYASDQSRLMQIVLREADRLTSLVGSFLLFAKPPAGRVEIIELDKAVMELIELFEKDKSCSGRITITRDLLPGLWVNMDPVHLRQILWNLLLNAAEAIKDSGTIGIRLYQTKNRHAAIEISDNGCGMPKEVMNSMFDPFFTTKSSGTGLGLSIVHSILESYGSRLDVESKIDMGTTVTMNIKQVAAPC